MSFKVGDQVQLLRHPEWGTAVVTRVWDGMVTVLYTESPGDLWVLPECALMGFPEHDPQPIESDPVAEHSGWLTALEEELRDVIENHTECGGDDVLTTMPTELALDLLGAIGGR
jgi:hypothetical protein